MEEKIIKIPTGIKYLADFKEEDDNAFELPNGICNKGKTGCGGTTLALMDNYKTIITSPRKQLMDNKKKQGYDNLLVVDGDVPDDKIEAFLNNCKGVPKIFVTYDSFYRVKKILGDDVYNWRLVLDEFHCLQTDASFKSLTIIRFMHQIEDMPYVTYLSATPIHPEYLKEIPELCDKPIYTLDWEEKTELLIARWKHNSPMAKVEALIRKYKEGFSFSVKDKNENSVACKELVFFVNSVKFIISVIKNLKLSKDEVNIIVANNEENQKIVKELGEGFSIGEIPLKGEPHKMLTFCTSTAYFGVDMYSESACTVVVSDIHNNNTSVDVASELLQIAGRQRNEANPFRNKILLIYNVSYSDVDEFKKKIDERWKRSKYELEYYKSLSGEERKDAIKNLEEEQTVTKFSFKYVYYDPDLKEFALNTIKYLADLLRCSAQYEIYKSVKCIDEVLKDNGFTLSGETKEWNDNVSFVKAAVSNDFPEKLKAYCEAMDSDNNFIRASAHCIAGKKYEKVFPLYYNLGTEVLEKSEYKESKLKKEWNLLHKHSEILTKVNKTFTINSKWKNPDIKRTFVGILEEVCIENLSLTQKEISRRYGIEFQETDGGSDEYGTSITIYRVIGQTKALKQPA